MKFIVIVVSVILWTCTSSQRVSENEQTNLEYTKGQITREALFVENPQWELGLEYYQPNAPILDSLKELQCDIRVEIFLGTWCGDSRREVPHFFKIVDMLPENYFEDITLWQVDRTKKIPGSQLTENRNIRFVATFIIFNGESEIGRIIEQPEVSLEHDLLTIIRN
jgi:hypothetical protein